MTWINFIHGDEKAFASIYNEYVDDLFMFGVKFHSDKDIVLDCIHDLFVNIFNNPKISKQVEIRFYLFSALRRRLLKVKKENSKFTEEEIPDNLVQISSPEFEWIKKEAETINVHTLKRHIEKLPKRQREVLFLRYYMDFSYEEISSIMNVSVESCRTLSYRAIKQLKLTLYPFEISTILLLYFKSF